MYYLNARYYDSTIARFLSEDTYRGQKDDPLSLNLYTYCVNNPIKYWDPSGHRILKRGCKGEDVRKLQTKLINLGYYLSPEGADGSFDPTTEKAVKKYQELHNVKEDDEEYGIVGPKTITSIGINYNAYRASTAHVAIEHKNNKNYVSESQSQSTSTNKGTSNVNPDKGINKGMGDAGNKPYAGMSLEEKEKVVFGNDRKYYDTKAEADKNIVTIKVDVWKYNEKTDTLYTSTVSLQVNKNIKDNVIAIF